MTVRRWANLPHLGRAFDVVPEDGRDLAAVTDAVLDLLREVEVAVHFGAIGLDDRLRLSREVVDEKGQVLPVGGEFVVLRRHSGGHPLNRDPYGDPEEHFWVEGDGIPDYLVFCSFDSGWASSWWCRLQRGADDPDPGRWTDGRWDDHAR